MGMITRSIGAPRASASPDAFAIRWLDGRLIAAIRWLLATTALTIIYLDPKEPSNPQWGLTYVFLVGNTVYSTVLYVLAARKTPWLKSAEAWEHWIDVAWYTILVGTCLGGNRIFFFGFLFAILVASFRRGFAAGLSVVFVSTLSITIVGFASETGSPYFSTYGFDVWVFILRPIYLMMLGYLMAYWGEQELTLKRGLSLLNSITLSNPRFGVDRTINSTIQQLRRFYAADAGFLIALDPRSNQHILYRVDSADCNDAVQPEAVSAELANKLLGLPDEAAVCYSSRTGRLILRNGFYAQNVVTGEPLDGIKDLAASLAVTLDAASLITVPLLRYNQPVGRLFFLLQNSKRLFAQSDVTFLLQVFERVNPVIENIRLVDRLASDAAEHERHRIARDIHDSVIQPYIGFQIGLSGMRRKLLGGKTDLNDDITRLLEMTSVGISDLRQYIGGLKTAVGEDGLPSSISRFCKKFSEATGIWVDVDAPSGMQINDGLAAEAFQMVEEGLSNVRRHTEATRAVVGLDCGGGKLHLRIENDGTVTKNGGQFTPRSISDRAASLGGRARVEKRTDGGTVVRIEVPL
jgi:signal transduction histidine kinase